MNRWLTVYLPALVGLWLFGGTVGAPDRPENPQLQRLVRPVPDLRTHSALMGNQSSAGGEFTREPH